MSGLAAEGPNAEQIRYWNEVSGPKWVELEPLLDAQMAPLGLAAMERAGVAVGERVIDVGCGCGQTSVQLAERVGATGAVLGVDLSDPMLSRARARAAHLPQAAFAQADAQRHPFEPGATDLVFSRFGVMFFADPDAAFANLRAALRPGGRLAFVCWQGLARNPWLRVPLEAVAPLVELPAPPAPGAPGPFSLADPERLRGILASAGFDTVELTPHESLLAVGGPGNLERAVSFVTQMGPAGAVLREADDAVRERAAHAVREVLAPHAGEGGVRMESAAWLVTARASPAG